VEGSRIRKILVVLQFSASIALIAGAFLINQQFNFLLKKDLGYNKDGVIYFLVRDDKNSFEFIKEEILKYTGIESASVASHIIDDVSHYITLDWEGKNPDERTRINTIFADHDLIQTLGMEIIKGRDFDKMNPRDTSEAFIINEKLADLMGFENPVGRKFSLLGRTGKVIGVVKNFHFKPLQYEIEPLALTVIPDERFYCYAKISGHNTLECINQIKNEYEKLFHGEEFQYYFLDQTLANLYENEARLKQLINIFTILIIIISLMGLFGLAIFIANAKTKEVCIRKVLGASVFEAMRFFVFYMLKLVLIANVIGLPIAYYFINMWLQNFSYTINITIRPFIFSSILTCVLALITISYQSVKVVKENPTKILQYE